LAGNSRRTPFDFAHPGIHRLSSPAGNSTQSGNGGVVLPVTPDTDLPPSLGHIGCALMEVSTPEDIQGTSGGSSMMPSSASLTGTGLGEEGVGRVHLVPLLVLVSFTPTTICSCRRNLGQQKFATVVEIFPIQRPFRLHPRRLHPQLHLPSPQRPKPQVYESPRHADSNHLLCLSSLPPVDGLVLVPVEPSLFPALPA